MDIGIGTVSCFMTKGQPLAGKPEEDFKSKNMPRQAHTVNLYSIQEKGDPVTYRDPLTI